MQGSGSCWTPSAAAAWYLPQRWKREAPASAPAVAQHLMAAFLQRSISEEKHVSCKKTSWGKGWQPTKTLYLTHTHTYTQTNKHTHTHCKTTSCGFSFHVFLNTPSTVPAKPSKNEKRPTVVALAFLCGFLFNGEQRPGVPLVFLITAGFLSCASPLTDCARAGPCWLMHLVRASWWEN